VQFVKMHGAGNDFVLLDLLRPDITQPTPTEWSALAVAMCDRHFGVGSDGLLLVLPSDQADVRMRMFNPDGSESASCGNGIRCLGRYVHDRYALGKDELRVETGAGVSAITVHADGTVTVDMGAPILAPEQIPTTLRGENALDVALEVDGERLDVSCVSMGNPHAITFVAPGALASYPLETVGPKVEHHPTFPQRTNFEICEVLATDHMRIRVWERGAGITLACGTGACAATVAAVLGGRLTAPARIDLPGGTLRIDWAPGGTVKMTGPAEYVFTGAYRVVGTNAAASAPAQLDEAREVAVVG
jgi:diaminopimelate epimerase